MSQMSHQTFATLEGGRYELLRELGAGAHGVVWAARDTRTGNVVAVKSVRWATPEDHQQLKREFRSLRDVVHPCLVPLGRLVVDGGSCFFTMAFVEGETLDRAITRWRTRGGELAWILPVLRDVADGIGALHSHGKLHRDIKPSNVLVGADGRARLIDYGFVSNLRSQISTKSREGSVAGTFRYASPEALRGGALSLASDWYAFGVLLYEALCGQSPFGGLGMQVLGLAPAPPPAEVPPALADLCVALLAPDPDARPGYAAVAARLAEFAVASGIGVGTTLAREVTTTPVSLVESGTAPVQATVVQPPLQRPTARSRDLTGDEPLFVGRADALGWLRGVAEVAAREPVLAILEGESGVGKTHLAEHVLAGYEREGALVLRGRCHLDERLPFNAFDAAADELARSLELAAPGHVAAAVPHHAEALVRLFPVLRRALGKTEAQASPSGSPASLALAADALADLLSRLALHQRVMVLLDDMQWADRDSVALLGHLLGSPSAPPVLVVATVRLAEGGRPPDFLVRLAPRARRHRLAVLGGADRDELAEALAGQLSVARDTARTVADASGGSPYYLRVLMEHAAGSGGSLTRVWQGGLARFLAARIGELDAADRAVLELVVVSGAPVPLDVLAVATGRIDRLWSALEALEAAHLVRRVAAGETVAAWHGAVADAAALGLSPAARSSVHAALADAYEAAAVDAPLARARHLFAAGRGDAAVRVAISGVTRAESRHAFAQAAELYEMVLAQGGMRATAGPDLLASAGRALIHSGRGGRGAELLAEAAAREEAQSGRTARSTALRREAAYSFLRSGRYVPGRALFKELLGERGVRWRKTRFGALVSLLWHRLKVLPRRPHAEAVRRARAAPSTDLTERLELMWAAGASLSLYDAIRAFDFHARHARLAERAADPRHLALSLGTRALIGALEGGRGSEERASSDLVAARRLAELEPHPQTDAHLFYMASGVAFLRGRYAESMRVAQSGLRFCREVARDTHWERANLQWLEASARVATGDLAGAAEHVDVLLADAEMSGDFYLQTLMRLGLPPLAYLALDQPDRALAACRAGREAAGASGFLDAQFLRAAVPAALYTGDVALAERLLEDVWPALRRQQILRLQLVRIDVVFRRASVRLARAAAPAPARTRARALRLAGRDGRRLAGEGKILASALGDLVTGQEMWLGGREASDVPLALAAERFGELGARPLEAVARACTERARGGNVSSALKALTSMGIVRPLTYAGALAPMLRCSARELSVSQHAGAATVQDEQTDRERR